MRALSKKNFEKSLDLCNFLKKPIDLERQKKVDKKQKYRFLAKTKNFKIPILLRLNNSRDQKFTADILKNISVTNLEIKDKI